MATTTTETTTKIIEINDEDKNHALAAGAAVVITVDGVEVVNVTVPTGKVHNASVNYKAEEEDA